MGFGSVSTTDCLFISQPSVLPDAKRGREKKTGKVKEQKTRQVLTILLIEATCGQ